jgi:hypothetical protein
MLDVFYPYSVFSISKITDRRPVFMNIQAPEMVVSQIVPQKINGNFLENG